MSNKFKLNDIEYDIDAMSERAKMTIASLQFASQRMQELASLEAVLQRAKNSYMDSLKKEMLSQKAGLLFSDD